MSIKERLQRVLELLADAEQRGGLSELDRDCALEELRQAYATLKFGESTLSQQHCESVAPPVVVDNDEELNDAAEAEFEIEILTFEGEEDNGEDECDEEVAPTVAPIEEPAAAPEPQPVAAPEPQKESDEVEAFRPRRSSILSLYDDTPHQDVVADNYREESAPSLADTISRPKDISESAAVLSLKQSIGVADRFMLIRELFSGDVDGYDRAIELLDNQSSLEDCMVLIAENYVWRAQSDATKFIMELLERRYKA